MYVAAVHLFGAIIHRTFDHWVSLLRDCLVVYPEWSQLCAVHAVVSLAVTLYVLSFGAKILPLSEIPFLFVFTVH